MTVGEILDRLDRVHKSSAGWTARCPAHEDRNPSLSVGEGRDGCVVLKCFAGCTNEEIVAALHLTMSDLFQGGGGASYPRRTPSTGQQSEPGAGCTLADYASAKGLPVPFLEGLGVSEITFQNARAVRFPYLSAAGEELCIRYRVTLTGDLRVRTKAGNKHVLYGLNRLDQAAEAGYLLLVEGESDAQTLWLNGYPAVGLPGANSWNEARDAEHLADVGAIYVVIEPDKGGDAVLKWVGASAIRERVRLVQLDGAKDVSELYLADRDRFSARLEQSLQTATPWAERERVASEIRARAAWGNCEDLAREEKILKVFGDEVAKTGLSGEGRAAKLLYLILTSRVLDRPVSAAVKGPSAGGKSFLVETVSSFFPPAAIYALTAMSERALAYGTEPLSHRHLVLYEAAGLEGDFASYIVRSLLSEGRVRYETVEKTSQGLQPRLIEREGPTGLITTTTAVALHPENETRLLSLQITDTRDQTKDVLRALAADNVTPPDVSRWVALQEWLSAADHGVMIPFAEALADLVPPVAVRLRRDFGQVLNLIRAHAILHQATRKREGGRIVATIEQDYAVVRGLVRDLISEGVEATVPPIVRETVLSVKEVNQDEGISLALLARNLGVDKAAASRRWNSARARGYLKNLETGRGKPARLVLADPLPDDVEILPTVEVLTDRCAVDRVSGGVETPPPPDCEQDEVDRLEAKFPDLARGEA